MSEGMHCVQVSSLLDILVRGQYVRPNLPPFPTIAQTLTSVTVAIEWRCVC